MTYAFTFDASACSGCKACQIACKDKNNLPLGVLWRRVYEVSGGSWYKHGNAWITDVFAYNMSIACNHCTYPKCAGVCPTSAYSIRKDGIVLLDSSKCMGCGYCSWACPYSAPQYDREAGAMTKCNFCFDNLDIGLPPACVAACPMRVLDCVEATSNKLQEFNGKVLWQIPAAEYPYPLPTYSNSEPHLAIEPHAAMSNGMEKSVVNKEEIRPYETQSNIWRFWTPQLSDFGMGEWPLVAFTILAQMAAGMASFALTLSDVPFMLLLMIGITLGIAGLFSFLHLGSPFNAWRALNRLNKSWLSREILMTVLFGVSWLLTLIFPGVGKWIMAITGIGLVYSMTQVYKLKSVPEWNIWRTPVSFFLSAGTLGLLAVNFWNRSPLLTGVAALLMIGELVTLPEAPTAYKTVREARVSLIRAGMIGAFVTVFLPDHLRIWANVPIILFVFTEEMLGRWLFYEAK